MKTSSEGHSRWGCVIVAAGTGSRFRGDAPKQFADLGGRPVLDWSLGTFLGTGRIEQITVVLPRDGGFGWAPPADARVRTARGGDRRQDSVLSGIRSLDGGLTHALVHDAARPLVGRPVVLRVMDAAERSGAAAPVVPMRDTLKRVVGGRITATVPREGLGAVQTPQGFRIDLLGQALSDSHDTLPDECAALEAAGFPVEAVEGDPFAMKLTDPPDMPVLEALAGRSRFGTGIDFHRFTPGRPLRVCGLELSPDGGLEGHSDGDAVLHAVADSLLSACRLGDIGTLFPSDDPSLAGIDSSALLGEVSSRVAADGWEILQVDVTIVGEKPRIAPERARMTARLAAILGIPEDFVWIKGTTTNTIGDLGRGLGLGAFALAAVRRRLP